jgi:hypothetical protein
MKIIIEKHRNGRIGEVDAHHNKYISRITDAETEKEPIEDDDNVLPF